MLERDNIREIKYSHNKSSVMKKIMLLFLLVATGCVTQINHIPEYLDVYITDFRPYSEKGFYFSPYSFDGEHTPIGQLSFKFTPEMELIISEEGTTVINWEQGPAKTSKWERISPPERLIELVYETCIELGADAFVDFSFSREPVNSIGAQIESIEYITGYAIKRMP